jgi:hypothetical protein
MTDEELERLERLAAAATMSPWQSSDDGGVFHQTARDGRLWVASCYEPPDWPFIAAARDAVPRLCAEVRRLREVIADSADARPRLAAERDALRIEASELRACLADAVGKIEAMRAENERLEALVDALNERIGGLT